MTEHCSTNAEAAKELDESWHCQVHVPSLNATGLLNELMTKCTAEQMLGLLQANLRLHQTIDATDGDAAFTRILNFLPFCSR